MKLLEKIFGTYSGREIKKIEPLVDKIEAIEEELKGLKDGRFHLYKLEVSEN